MSLRVKIKKIIKVIVIKNLPESFEAFFKKPYNFDNVIRRRLTDHNKIIFAIQYLPMSHLK